MTDLPTPDEEPSAEPWVRDLEEMWEQVYGLEALVEADADRQPIDEYLWNLMRVLRRATGSTALRLDSNQGMALPRLRTSLVGGGERGLQELWLAGGGVVSLPVLANRDAVAAMETHPAADLFPLMEGDDFERLVDSIRQNGFDPLQPIVVDRDGRVIDGRNRARACEAVGILPLTVTYEGDDPFGKAVRMNIVRRHLTPSQIAGVLVKSERLREAQIEAKERQVASGRDYGKGSDPKVPPPGQEPFRGESAEVVAKEFGISRETLRRAQVPEIIGESGRELMREAIEQLVSARELIIEAAGEDRIEELDRELFRGFGSKNESDGADDQDS